MHVGCNEVLIADWPTETMRASESVLDKVGRSCSRELCLRRDAGSSVTRPGLSREREGTGARRVRQRIPESGPTQEDLLHAHDPCDLPARFDHPTPNVNVEQVSFCLKQATTGEQQGLYSLINLFSGGALLQLAIFALGIMPYITASIILQLLTVVIPRLEALKKEGQAGQTKITQYTRYLTLVLAVLNSTAFVTVAVNDRLFTGCPGLVYDKSIFPVVVMILTMTAGTGVIMWLGELITERGVGNGMSVLIFTQIAATFPSALWSLKVARPGSQGWIVFLLVIALGLLVMAGVIFVELSQRRIPVQYAKRMVGRRMFGGTTTYIPIKVNQAGVIPVIFASSLLYLPVLYAQFRPDDSCRRGSARTSSGDHPVYIISFFLLIVFFAYFYVAITFNPNEVADNMKKYGGFIPGIRAGKPTEDYLASCCPA